MSELVAKTNPLKHHGSKTYSDGLPHHQVCCPPGVIKSSRSTFGLAGGRGAECYMHILPGVTANLKKAVGHVRAKNGSWGSSVISAVAFIDVAAVFWLTWHTIFKP